MAEKTGIEWTDHTWNPWRGCTKVSPGCAKCYMFRDQERLTAGRGVAAMVPGRNLDRLGIPLQRFALVSQQQIRFTESGQRPIAGGIAGG